MTGISYKVEIDDAALAKRFDEIKSRLANPLGLHKNVGEIVRNSVDMRFQTETAPDGSSWQALKPATIEARERNPDVGGLAILRATGRLAGSFNYVPTSEQVSIGTPVVEGAYHHFGTKDIVARPILGLSPDDELDILDAAEVFLKH